jgi:4-hydroxy-2-oxoheptanedioate aldolase
MFTMRKPLPTFREHLAGDEPVFGVFSKTNDPFFIEILGKSAFDFVILDREHGPNSIRELYPLVMAAWLNDLYPVVRVGSLEESEVQRVLDLGVAGIQIPHIESAADAERARRYIRFHPEGSRGVCRFVRAAEFTAMDRAAYFTAQNEVASILMIEGSSGVANAGAICQSPGHDVVFVGPYDLSQSLGIPGQVGDPRVTSLVESIVATCRASGRHAGVFVDTIAAARKYRALGVKYIAFSVDVGIFANACAELRTALHDPAGNVSSE